MATRQRILEIAKAEIGPQGKGSTQVYGYWRDVLPAHWTDAQVKLYAKTKEWCGGFALWCLRQAGIAQDVRWIDGLGFVGPAKLARTTTPEPGDIAITPVPFWHHAVVELCDKAQWVKVSTNPERWDWSPSATLITVDGNQPDVRRKIRPRPAPSKITYYSIASLLEPVSAPAASTPTLRQGSPDKLSVQALQGALNLHGARPPLVVDGGFGRKTYDALRAFQQAHSLTADGICGPRTWAALLALKS